MTRSNPHWLRARFVTFTTLLAALTAASPAAATIGIAKDATRDGREVTLDFYVENLGLSTLDPVAVVDDLDDAFGAGTYTVTSGPALVAGPGTLVLNGSFNGSGDTSIVTDGSLAPGATVQIRVVVEIDAVTNQGNGLGIYFNQATADANEGAFSDLSDDGTDPDPGGNGDPGDAGEDDPTLIDVTENPILGAAKNATLSGSTVTFDFYLENFGNRTLSDLALPDDLDDVFGEGNYTVTSGPALIDDPGTITVNAGFDGNADTALISSGSLAAGDTARIQVVVDVTMVTDRGAGPGVYSNQVTASGASPSGTVASDLSDAGTDPDPNGDGSPGGGGEADPTVFVVGQEPVVGVAKNAIVVAGDVTLDYYLENLGDVDLEALSLADDLDAVFGAGNYTMTSGPALVDDPGTITVNALFDGSAETALISGGTLAAGDTAQIRVVVHVVVLADLGSGLGFYENQVTASGESAAGAVTSDLSDAGTDPDPNGDGDPTGANEDDPTLFSVAQNPAIGAAKTASVAPLGANFQIFITLFLQNTGNVTLTGISLTDNLDDAFGSGNYNFVSDPIVTLGGGGSLGGNAAFTGSGPAGSTTLELLAAGGTMDPGAFAQIEVSLRLNNVTDQGFGAGTYFNQATANADGPAGAALPDLSDSGNLPDPDGDGDPSGAGEDDPTEIVVSTFIGAAKNAMVSGNEVTIDLYLEAFGAVTIGNLELIDDLDPVFGEGNYSVVSGPSLLDDPGTLAVNAGFDGSADTTLLAPGGALAAGDTAQVRIVVSVETAINVGSGLGAYVNQAQVFGETPGGSPLADDSTSGTDPDPDADGDPTDINTPTSFTVVVDPIVGVAKDASVAGTEVTLDFYLESFGSLPSGQLTLADDLDAVFGAGNYTITTGPAFLDDPGTLALNGAFDGSADLELLAAGSTLASGDTAQIRVVVDVTNVTDQGLGNGVYENQATLTGSDATGVGYSDLSVSGIDPDPGGDGDPTSDTAPTLFFLGEAVIGHALKAYVSGTEVTFDYYFENLADAHITGVQLRHNLNAVFGPSSNYSVLQQPTLMDGPATLLLSPQFFGFNIFDRVVVDGTLAVGETVRVRVVVNVNNVTNQGDGLGVYTTQTTVDAFAADGMTPTSDLSDDGILTDPNGNGDPMDAGEDDPTLVIIGEESTIGLAKDATVTGSQVLLEYRVENLGNVAVDGLTMTDDLDAVFGAGNYTVTGVGSLGPMGGPTANTSFDGSADTELFDPGGGALGPGELVNVQVTVNVTTILDLGLGLGNYTNQALVSGTGPSGTVAQDLSDAGTDPDPNGNGNPADAGESDPTTFAVTSPALGAAKNATVDGSVVTLDFYVENLGTVALTDVAMSDDLDDVFGAGNYAILAPPSIVGELHDIVPNASFDGSSDTSLIASGGLPPGTTEQIRVVVLVTPVTNRGSGLGIYSNQVTATALDPDMSPVSDLSDAGTDPDPNGNSDPTEAGEDDPTVFAVPENPTVGVAKTAAVDGDTVTFDVFLESFANVVPSVGLVDDLDSVFGAGNYSVTSAPALIVDPGTLVLNGAYDGSSQVSLLAGGSTLAIGATAQIRFVVELIELIDSGSGVGVYANQATVTATGPGATVVQDLSDSGTDPDPDGDSDPTEAGENDPTAFAVTERSAVGVAKTASVEVDTVTFDVFLESFANVAPAVSLVDELDAVFGAGNYTVTSAPSLVVDPGTLVLNGAYDGSSQTDLLAAGSTLAVGATAKIRFAVEVIELTDQGSGLGVYANQATVTATGPGATIALDLSDAGTDPDPDGDSDPTEAGENDPTVFAVAEDPTVGVAKTATVEGDVVTFDVFLESFANVAPDLVLVDGLDAGFGAGNYSVTSAPSLVVDPGTLVLNAAYDGSTQTDLLAAGSTLAVGATAQIRFEVEILEVIDQGDGLGVYSNQAKVTATGPGATVAQDLSDAGTDPDPDGDSDPTEAGEDDPTVFAVAEDPTVGAAKTATVDGDTVTFDVFLESFANVASDVGLVDELDAVFGAGKYSVTGAPSLVVDPGTLVLNAAYDGSAQTGLLAAGSTLAAGATAQIRFVVEVSELTDLGSGLGVYANQATVTATGPGATLTQDLSDAGSDPDPGDDGDPGGVDEDDPTPVVLADSTAPAVTAVSVSECETLRVPVDSITVTIEDDLTAIEGAGAATSYLLVEAGPDADFSTVACGATAGDDVEVGIAGLSLSSAGPNAVDVDLGLPGAGLPAGLYRLFVCDAVTDAFGNALDGDGDMSPGTDFVVPFFRADPFNLFENGHFDDCPASLAPWISTVTAPNAIVTAIAGVDDIAESPYSASAHLAHSVDEPSSLAQCVEVAGGFAHRLEARLRFEAAAGVVASFVATCELFDDVACAGASVGTSSTAALIEDDGGAWVPVSSSFDSPAGARSALCDFAIQAVGAEPAFDLYLDSLFLGADAVFFTDGFESGNTSAWSQVVP